MINISSALSKNLGSGAVCLEAKIREGGESGKLQFTNVSNNLEEHSNTSPLGAEYYADIRNVSGSSVNYLFPGNNALINSTAVSARYIYTLPGAGSLSWDGVGKRVKSVSLTVSPVGGTGKISFSDPNCAKYDQSFSSQKTITIDGVNLTTHELGFLLTNAVVVSASITYKYLQPYKFTKPTLPQISSVVDFSVDDGGKPKYYNSGLVVYGDDVSGAIIETTKYDAALGYWYTTAGNNNLFDMQPYSKNDSYWVWEHRNGLPVTLIGGVSDVWHGQGANDSQLGGYFRCKKPGITRHYFNSIENWPCTGYYGPEGYVLMYAGITQPVNTVLYNYGLSNNVITSSTKIENYINPTDDFNRQILKKLTTDACNKLKSKDVGARIYVIKYRIGEDQKKWNALTRTNETTYSTVATDHDYSAIDTCASSGYLYSASSQSELTTCLNKIADDIKNNFAEYKAAEVVE